METNRTQSAGMPDRRPMQTASTVPRKRTAMEAAEEAYVADEDRFVLRQAKRKAEIRVREGRARAIDWLAINLRFADPSRNPLDEDIADDELDVMDPEIVLDGLSNVEARELNGEIETFLTLETDRSNWDYWHTMKLILNDRCELSGPAASVTRASNPVASDIDKILRPKSFDELQALENQVRKRLQAHDAGDMDYWKQLLQSLLLWKAKAHFQAVNRSVMQGRLKTFGIEQYREATATQEELRNTIPWPANAMQVQDGSSDMVPSSNQSLDPEPLLKIRSEDRMLESVGELEFLDNLQDERRKLEKSGYQPKRPRHPTKIDSSNTESPTSPSRRAMMTKRESGQDGPMTVLRPYKTKRLDGNNATLSGSADLIQHADMLYQRELERGLADNEEMFSTEEDVSTSSQPEWASKYRPRKPKSLNRVQMGYEWNKYNQTHYDNENPPPKVVQGYKFNVFYPDLVDKSKAPTYRIEREAGRKKGEYRAERGADDYCTIRFVAGAPYADIAFRIVDRQWDYSARKDHGFRSAFENVSPSV
ncbi:MAG: hypothetical protein Q9157_000488 [Trypethelium eluteriae]